MKKAIACLLVLPLTLAACGAQTTQPAPTTAPEMTTEATTENGKSAPAEVTQPGITGRMRPCSTEVETDAGLYTLHELFNEAANENVYCVVKTDIETATQEKVASITLDGGYYASGKRIIRRDRTTNEVSYINLPEQTINVYGAGDKWVIHRIVSPSPLPSNVDGDEYNAVFQNSEYEYDLFDAATGEMKKLYSYPTSEDFYWYRGHRDGTLYFDLYGEDGYPTGVGKLENGEMVQVLARDDPYASEQVLENEQGELQWIVWDEGESVQVYDLNDGQSYRPAFVKESSQYASTGYPEMLLPGGRVFVTHGSIDAPDFLDKIAYATQDRAAYLSGSTDYTPVTMYTGK